MSNTRYTTLASAGSVVWDTRFSTVASMVLTGDASLTLYGLDEGNGVDLYVSQDATGGHALVLNPLPGTGTTSVMSSVGDINRAANSITHISFRRISNILRIQYDSTTGGSAALSKVGKTYSKSAFTNLSDFVVNTVAATASANTILIPNAGVTDFTKSLQLASFSCVNHWKIEMEFRLTTTIGAGTTGISLGIQSTNADSLNSWAVFFSTSTTNTGRMEFFAQSNSGSWTSISSAASNLTFVANDLVRLSLERVNQNVYMRAENLTNPVAPVYYATTHPFAANPIPPNTGHFSLWGQGGTFTVSKLTVWNNELKNPNIMFLGDSKTMGYGASSFQTTYPGVLGKLFANVSISAGFGDKTSDILSRMPEIIAISPKQCVVSLGSNDIRFGVSEAVFEANYINIVNQLTSAGIDVIHILPSYETPLDLTAQYNWMKATFTQTIDVFYKIRETGNLYTDSIHWSVAGNREAAQFILDSLYLKGGKTDQEF